MNLRAALFLADENIHPEVVMALRQRGVDMAHVKEAGLAGASDARILQHAVKENRIVLTHDSDFGMLAILQGQPVVGIVYFRPGHIAPIFVLETIETLLNREIAVTPPFIVVAERGENRVTMRVRQL